MSIRKIIHFALIECYYIDTTKKGTAESGRVKGNEKF